MDDYAQRALAKWPNVPSLFGWLGLTRKGEWLIQSERITHPRIVDAIARNYDRDEHGRWFFQNGPQRGYVALEYTPLVARVQADDSLVAHTGRAIDTADALYLDEDSAAVLDTPAGAVLIQGADLAWVLARLHPAEGELDDTELERALTLPGGTRTALTFDFAGQRLPVHRVDAADMAATLGFVAEPEPLADEAGG
ncbi:DUF2946 family protein [Salinisphaera sp. T31B1]|uniref:DUF2946 family protein n=1 Tax=Salinisphaera sp. T31B1 TaxID=727963 RepID=UPI00333EBEA7